MNAKVPGLEITKAAHVEAGATEVDGLDEPILLIFPELTICIDCGTAQFNVPKRELRNLGTGARVDEAVILYAA